jgi:peptidoglycan/xylan/chitin deacetylase (PgdA/CDA1 family)
MGRLFALLMALALAACATAAPSSEKRIAVTFDDVPRDRGAWLDDDERTQRLIAGLSAAGVKQAAFFLNPGRIPGKPGAEGRIAAYVAAGHVIANHSATHLRLNATDVPTYLADIDAAETWLKGRAGYRPWFRFPYLDEGGRDLAKRDAIRAGLAARGLTNGYVTVDASDWFYEQASIDAVHAGKPIDRAALRDLYIESHVESAEFADALARRTLGRSPAHVLLLHETDLAAFWLADLVRALKAKGWTIVSADEAFADPISRIMPDVPVAHGTLIEAMAWQKGLPEPRWYPRNNIEVAGKLFEERVLGSSE